MYNFYLHHHLSRSLFGVSFNVIPYVESGIPGISGTPSLREKCLNTEFFLVCIFLYSDWIRNLPHKSPYSVWMQGNTDQKKFRIWTLFMQCIYFYLSPSSIVLRLISQSFHAFIDTLSTLDWSPFSCSCKSPSPIFLFLGNHIISLEICDDFCKDWNIGWR